MLVSFTRISFEVLHEQPPWTHSSQSFFPELHFPTEKEKNQETSDHLLCFSASLFQWIYILDN